ncbi:MAG: protein-glutamate O-methyltransferase CheR [Gammaproteobacteria bacterium]|nr:protein-glutamate O-methyltransferase CheR [Gammaproteobacteria bacterium]MCP5195352.1 protein-glutamate O-methyltransferase CheR [Gammaproteobacteria bacterium]
MNSPAAPTISEEEFQKFRDFFYRKTGIYFEENKRYFVDKRLIERIKATDNETFRNYFVMLRFETSGKELQQLINLMTVNETYFFREEYQFTCLVKSVLADILPRKRCGEPIRIWSIPSSSGEEPYSLAIYLLEYWPQVNAYDIELIASDIDTEILKKARQGRYDQRSISHLPAHLLHKHFTTTANGAYQISDDLRNSIDFTQVNITDLNQMRIYRNFDVVFCRNLLIYFDDTSRRIAAEALFNALRPGGFICLGHSESMSRITPLFKIRKFPEAIIYQKPLR